MPLRSATLRWLVVVACAGLPATRALAGSPASEDMINSYEYRQPYATTGDAFMGAGFGGFTAELGHAADAAFVWNLRAGINFARVLGAEFAYEGNGAAFSDALVAAGAPSGLAFSKSQFTLNGKLGCPLVLAGHLLRLYGVGGGGYAHVEITGRVSGKNYPDENVGAFPLGAGVSYDITRNFLIDGRYTYDFLTDRLGNSWGVVFSLGGKWGG